MLRRLLSLAAVCGITAAGSRRVSLECETEDRGGVASRIKDDSAARAAEPGGRMRHYGGVQQSLLRQRDDGGLQLSDRSAMDRHGGGDDRGRAGVGSGDGLLQKVTPSTP